MKPAHPPRAARGWLKRALPADVREDIIDDLQERFERDASESGPNAARWRYRRAVLGFSLRFLWERLRDRVTSIGRVRLSLLDFRLGLRMLVRYPLLTIVGGIALSFAVAIGAAVFAFISLLLWPSLPLPEGDRIVSVELYDDMAARVDQRTTADFFRWQRQSTSLTELGAGRTLRRNVTTTDGLLEQVVIAEVTASTFGLVRFPPLLGRALTDADAHPSAPPVLVIGHGMWSRRFGRDPTVVGQAVSVGSTATTIVGVMPEGMSFPSAHEAWVPLRLDEAAVPPRSGTPLNVWARLKPGISLTQASAEMSAIGRQAKLDWPQTHATVSTRVRPFAEAASMQLGPAERLLLGSVNLGVGLLILLISGNVALLMFARAATRENEILMRTALGASRGRVIAQFFSEALVLSAIAAAIGLWMASIGVEWGTRQFAMAANDGQPLPFWFDQPLPPVSIAYGIGLALFASLITGVLPALKVTRGLQSRLRETPGGGGLKFGGVWTVLIVSQVAVTVTFPVVTFFIKRDGWQIASRDIGLPPEQVLSARLTRDRDTAPERYAAAVRELRDGMAAVPGVQHAAVADKLPLMWHGHFLVEVDEGGAAPREDDLSGYRISAAAVSPEFFPAFDAPPMAGRLFGLSDYVERPRVVVVNQPFVDRVLGGRNPVGRRVRFMNVENGAGSDHPRVTGAEPWLEIVGLVRDLGMASLQDPKAAGIYLPLELQATSSVLLAARVNGDLASASKALRGLAARADATLRVTEVQPLDQVTANALREIDFWVRLLGAVSFCALMLSLTGIYAVMSFAVSRRTREIGIRVALGSDRVRVLLSVLRGPLRQVAAGVGAGALLTSFLSGQIVSPGVFLVYVAAYSAVMFGVCLLACILPARRALRVDPVDALRST